MFKKIFFLVLVVFFFFSCFSEAFASERQPIQLKVSGSYSRAVDGILRGNLNPSKYTVSTSSNTTIFVKVRTGYSSNSGIYIQNRIDSSRRTEPLFFDVYAFDKARQRNYRIGSVRGTRLGEGHSTSYWGDVTIRSDSSEEFKVNNLVKILDNWSPPPRVFCYFPSRESWQTNPKIGEKWLLFDKNEDGSIRCLRYVLRIDSIGSKGKVRWINFVVLKGRGFNDDQFNGRILCPARK